MYKVIVLTNYYSLLDTETSLLEFIMSGYNPHVILRCSKSTNILFYVFVVRFMFRSNLFPSNNKLTFQFLTCNFLYFVGIIGIK